MTAISTSSARRKAGSSQKRKDSLFSAIVDRQRLAQRTRKVLLPVLLHHNQSFSRLYNIRKLDSTEKHDN